MFQRNTASVFIHIFILFVSLWDPGEYGVAGYQRPVRLRMDLSDLDLVEGVEERVRCTVDRPRCFFIANPVEFKFIRIRCEDCDWEQLTLNDQVTNGQEEYYGINVTTGWSTTTFELIYKNPRPRDDGVFLKCTLHFDPNAKRDSRSDSYRRTVFVHAQEEEE